MIEWQQVADGRAREVTLKDSSTAWVLVKGEDGGAQFFTGVAGPGELAGATATGGLPEVIDNLTALDIIDIVCRSCGSEDPGLIADA